ncbi:MAG TPA: hypothetical protein IAA98_14095, partial [Candidatus Avipropionibacterium avicola]|nr:hypothetical protein [Candidatus Avipropionibacterium avicola]
MDAQRESPRSRVRWLVAIGGAVATGLAAGAGLARRRRRQQEEAELWSEARRADLPRSVPEPESVVPESTSAPDVTEEAVVDESIAPLHAGAEAGEGGVEGARPRRALDPEPLDELGGREE